jgi:dTDP-4-dehydrorhamnose reductase
MKINLVTGNGKLGHILRGRPNFHFLDCDITKIDSIHRANGWTLPLEDVGVVVNCAAISSIDECEKDYQKAIDVNVHGLANLHKVFGERVLNIGSDQIFNGRFPFPPSEHSKPDPINNYGFTKLAAEQVSKVYGGKTIRLSRTVSLDDVDIAHYLTQINSGNEVEVPTFLHRNYLHREFAVDGIEYFVNNYEKFPDVVNFGGLNNVSFYDFMDKLNFHAFPHTLHHKVIGRRKDNGGTPRPHHGGFRVDLAKKLGFPMRNVVDTVSKLGREYDR